MGGFCAFFGAVDEWNANLLEIDLLELRKHRVTQCFSSDACTVGNNKYGAFDKGGSHEN